MSGAAEPTPAAGARRYLWGLAAAVAVCCLIAFVEIDAQSARVVDSAGRAWPFSVLLGLGTERQAGWREVLSTGLVSDPLFRALFSWHLVIDLIFVVAYGCLLAGLVSALFSSRPGRRGFWLLLAAAVAVDLIEDLVVVVVLLTRSGTPWLAVLNLVTTTKWILIALLGLGILVRFVVPRLHRDPGDIRATIGRTLRALMHHRFSLAIVVPLMILTMLSGSAILEQLPDVQRRWVSDGLRGWLQAACAVAAVLAVSVLLEVLARFRTGWAERHPGDEPVLPPRSTERSTGPWLRPLLGRLGADLRLITIMIGEAFTDRSRLRRRLRHLRGCGDALLGLWLLGAFIPLVAALLAALFMDAEVMLPRLAVFCSVPIVVVVGSWILRRAWQIRPDWDVPYLPPRFTAAEIATIRFTGHALALTVITVGGIGLVRSYLSVVALGPSFTGIASTHGVLFLVLGIAGVTLPWLISWILASSEAPDPLSTVGSRAPTSLGGRWVLLGVVLGAFVLIGLFPGPVAALGVSAVAIASLASLIGIPAAAGLLIQERPTAEIFRILGLRRTPLVSVLVITVALAGLTAGASTIHRVADTPADAEPARPPVTGMVDRWLAQPGACQVEVDGRPVRPMIMVAAEGGGIRAAYWTVQALAALDTQTRGCGARSTLFSGGASGGSVGLTVARFAGSTVDPGTSRAVGSVRALADPDTLGQAVIGTFVRDPVYGATGVPLGTNGVAPAGSWADRARLLELGWNRSYDGAAWGTSPFLTDPATLSPATGPLVINSSSVASQCRVWVSQLDLEQQAVADGEQRCDQRVGPGARTIDLYAAYGSRGPSTGGAGTGCLGSVQASTAALLTARFPYVTPGGVVGLCPAAAQTGVGGDGTDFWPLTQLIDGGYIENTGLATITDLSAQWLAQVRTHNEDVVAGRTRQPLIVPLVVFLTNEQATAGRLTQPPALQSELLLPAIGYLRGSGTLTRTDALLQRVATTVRTRSICPPPRAGAVDCDAVADAFPRRVIVVDRTAQPEVTAPLGWVLSQASMTGLDRAMRHQLTTVCEPGSTEPVCLRGYGTLGDLIGYLRR